VKQCTKCGQTKSPSAFCRDRTRLDGYHPWCTECKVQNNHQRRLCTDPEARKREAERQQRAVWLQQGLRQCSRCRQVKPLEAFYRNRADASGRRDWCKECVTEYSSAPVARARANARRRERYIFNPEYKARRVAQNLAWTQQHPEVGRRATQKRRALVAGLPHDLTENDWLATLKEFSYRCAWCGVTDVPLQQDHFYPPRLGGGYTRDNIVPACAKCNVAKSDRHPLDWAWYQGVVQQKPGSHDDLRMSLTLQRVTTGKGDVTHE